MQKGFEMEAGRRRLSRDVATRERTPSRFLPNSWISRCFRDFQTPADCTRFPLVFLLVSRWQRDASRWSLIVLEGKGGWSGRGRNHSAGMNYRDATSRNFCGSHSRKMQPAYLKLRSLVDGRMMRNKWKFFQGIYIDPRSGRLTFSCFFHWRPVKFVSSWKFRRLRVESTSEAMQLDSRTCFSVTRRDLSRLVCRYVADGVLLSSLRLRGGIVREELHSWKGELRSEDSCVNVGSGLNTFVEKSIRNGS